jgi:hypothetical protein
VGAPDPPGHGALRGQSFAIAAAVQAVLEAVEEAQPAARPSSTLVAGGSLMTAPDVPSLPLCP